MTTTTLSDTQLRIFRDRYSLRDADNNPTEDRPEQMWWRVAGAIAAVEATPATRKVWADRFYTLLEGFKFVPGGRILHGAGSGHEVTYYNCYCIPSPEDSRGGIFENLALWADIQARGGGVGVNLSTLRPRGSYIKSVNGTSSGPVSWAELYSVTTGDVIQQGGSRRGAAMIMLDDDHPDILEFIEAKRIDPRTGSPVTIEHANVSVLVSDAFMEAVEHDLEWRTQFPTKAEIERRVREGCSLSDVVITPGPVYRAREIWDRIAERAWETAEPGVVFVDRANRESNSYYYLTARCTNPCGEIALPPFHVCNLGALNLAAYVRNADDPPLAPTLDLAALAADTRTAVRFLDNAIDATPYFLEENERAQKGIRRTGLGTMGLADALIKLGLRYGSPDALAIVELIYSTIRNAAYEASAELAAEKGAAPDFELEPYLAGPFVSRLSDLAREKIRTFGIRNISLLCVAPTGTTSLLAGVSSGIEPVFAFEILRRDRTGEHVVLHPLAQAWQAAHPGAPLPPHFVTSAELTPEEHLAVQATVQRYVDQQISKTVNAPNDHTVEDVKRLYRLAYESGCKGVTYYREGSRDAVLTRVEGTKDGRAVVGAGSGDGAGSPGPDRGDVALPDPHVAAAGPAVVAPRPRVLSGYTREIAAPEGDAHVTVNSDGDGPLEVFITVGRAGSDLAAGSEAMGRLISLILRLPSPMTRLQRALEVASQLRGIGGSRSIGFGPERVRSLADAVSQVLDDHTATVAALAPVDERALVAAGFPTEEGAIEAAFSVEPVAVRTGDLCPACGSLALVRAEGCSKCLSCGHSAC